MRIEILGRYRRSARNRLLCVAVLVATAFGLPDVGDAGYAAIPLSECTGEELHGKKFYLTADLDCAAIGDSTPTGGLWFNRRSAKLDLNGFSVRNASRGVFCGKCKITGPGTIADSTSGIEGSNIRVSDVTLRDNEREGIRSVGKLRIENSLIENNGIGATGVKKVRITDSVITGNRMDGLFAVAYGGFNNPPVTCTKSRVKIKNSDIVGNNIGPQPEPWACDFSEVIGCADIRTCNRAPVIDAASSCDTSFSVDQVNSWGVCALD